MERVVLYAIPNAGHLFSTLELAKLLLAHNPSLSVTILYPTIPLNPLPSITINSLADVHLIHGDLSNFPVREAISFEILRNSNPNVRDFLHSLSLSSPVSAFILDMMCFSSLDVSKSLGIPTYVYFPSNASALSLFLNFPQFDKIATDSFRNLGKTPFQIPGLFSVPATSMPQLMLDPGLGYDEFVNMGAYLPKADGVIINTVESIEPRTIKALRDGTCLLGPPVPPIYCIGPLVADLGENDSGGERNECLNWLDLQPRRSVVYLGFGSRGLFSRDQTMEIAIGLEKSGVRFLWAVRPPPSEDSRSSPVTEPDLDSLLPVGFLERTKDRGLVVKSWVPQVSVLKHEAVGGFVTHCGWNSTLEAISVGVPMVAWPLYAEQFFNKILLVEEIGIALPMDESNDRFVCSDEIEKRVKQIIGSNEGNVIRNRVLDLSLVAKAAFCEGGSSKVALAKLMESWKQ